jgi:hypothetical protein
MAATTSIDARARRALRTWAFAFDIDPIPFLIS